MPNSNNNKIFLIIKFFIEHLNVLIKNKYAFSKGNKIMSGNLLGPYGEQFSHPGKWILKEVDDDLENWM